MKEIKPVGQTASGGFQVGVRRTFPITIEEAWDLVTSTEGLNTWLGGISSSFRIQAGQTYHTEDGISGEIRVVNQFQNIRLSWKKENWETPSTLQIRTIPSGNNKTTISFHQESLSDSNAREEMKLRWEEMLNRFRTIT